MFGKVRERIGRRRTKALCVFVRRLLKMVNNMAECRHDCPVGVHVVIGADANCTLECKGGSAYPIIGTVTGVQFPPRSLHEAKKGVREAWWTER
jgi:hypothetical protein